MCKISRNILCGIIHLDAKFPQVLNNCYQTPMNWAKHWWIYLIKSWLNEQRAWQASDHVCSLTGASLQPMWAEQGWFHFIPHVYICILTYEETEIQGGCDLSQFILVYTENGIWTQRWQFPGQWLFCISQCLSKHVEEGSPYRYHHHHHAWLSHTIYSIWRLDRTLQRKLTLTF